MNGNQENRSTNQEKNLIAMGAAMGAGCRTCADKLYEAAISLKIPEADMLKAFHLGLAAKTEAIETMKAKISALMGDGKVSNTAVSEEYPKKLASLIRIASFVAANSAPDAISEIRKAREDRITPDQIQMCISLAKMVRKNAEAFSDQELSDKACSIESNGEETCCPLSSNSKNALVCSCGSD